MSEVPLYGGSKPAYPHVFPDVRGGGVAVCVVGSTVVWRKGPNGTQGPLNLKHKSRSAYAVNL